MNLLVLIIILVVGIAIGAYFSEQKKGSAGGAGAGEDPEWAEKQTKILALFETKSQIKNDDVENLLGVSDATSTRYLQKLEDKKLIVQRGEGKGTYYERL